MKMRIVIATFCIVTTLSVTGYCQEVVNPVRNFPYGVSFSQVDDSISLSGISNEVKAEDLDLSKVYSTNLSNTASPEQPHYFLNQQGRSSADFNEFDSWFRLRGGSWGAIWNFDSTTTSGDFKVRGGAMLFIAPSVQFGWGEKTKITASIGYERDEGDHVSANLGTATVGLSMFTGRFLTPYPDRIDAYIGAIGGAIDVDSAPGKFDTSIGLVGGLVYTKALTEHFGIDFGVEYRDLSFDFKPNSTVTASDSSIGGSGAAFILGIDYRF